MLIIRSLWFNWAIFYDLTIGLVVYWSSVKQTLILFQLIVSFTYQFRILKHYHRWCLLLLNTCRYFMLVIAVYAHTKNKDFLVCANVSERIIVRVSLTKRCLKLLAADVLSVLQRLRLKWRLRGRLDAKKFQGPKFFNLWDKGCFLSIYAARETNTMQWKPSRLSENSYPQNRFHLMLRMLRFTAGCLSMGRIDWGPKTSFIIDTSYFCRHPIRLSSRMTWTLFGQEDKAQNLSIEW